FIDKVSARQDAPFDGARNKDRRISREGIGMKSMITALALTTGVALATGSIAQETSWQPDPTRQQTYTPHRVSSTDPTGANADSRQVAPGATFTVMDVDGPGTISHIWFTIADNEPYHL